jgi:hypothetical protein
VAALAEQGIDAMVAIKDLLDAARRDTSVPDAQVRMTSSFGPTVLV